MIPNSYEEWQKERKNGLGASDAGAIIGVNPWKSNVELWEEKTGRKEPEDISDKPYVKYGHDAEEHIRALFALDHPELTVSYESPYKIIRNPVHQFIFCTPDGELQDSEGNHGGLEVKTTEIMQARQWKEWDNRIPDQYFCQVIWQMIATGWEFVYLCALIKYTTKNGEKRKEIREYRIDRADVLEDIAYLTEEGIEFWEAVQKKKCPPLRLPAI